jgi:hypothetical protein
MTGGRHNRGVIDAEAMLAQAGRPLVLGIGGGGDVVGALATAEACRIYHGAEPILGGIAWERRVIDPHAGPRSLEEIEGGEPLARAVLSAGPDTHVRDNGVRFAEAGMAEVLGDRTVLVDVLGGPGAVAAGLAETARRLDADLLVFVDVGGDVLAHGDEPGLASPLCDAVMLSAASTLERDGLPVLCGVFGPGCDGELTIAELLDRLAEVAAAGGLAGARGLTPAVVARLEDAIAVIPTEASAQAVRCFRGEHGQATIRGGRRIVELSPLGAMTVYFGASAAVASAARLARAVEGAASLEEANERLRALGVRTELDYERAALDR